MNNIIKHKNKIYRLSLYINGIVNGVSIAVLFRKGLIIPVMLVLTQLLFTSLSLRYVHRLSVRQYLRIASDGDDL